MLTVSIVIHNTPHSQVTKAVECLLRTDPDKIFILDNGSSPFDHASLSSNSKIEYRRIPNDGFGAGHNIAIREVTARWPEGYHLVMNADVEWEGDAITPLIKYLACHKDVGLVQPRIVYPDGILQYTCRLLPSPIDLFAKRFLPAPLRKNRLDSYLLTSHNHRQPLEAAYLQGSFLLFRNKALVECGAFDERFFMYPEDIDITRRIHRKWKVLYLPLTQVTHSHQAASRRNLRMFAIHLVNMCRYFNKWGWWNDHERKEINRDILRAVVKARPGEEEPGRG